MFDQLKQAMKLKGIHDQLKKEQVTVERDGVSVTINGAFVIENITLSETSGKNQEKLVKDCLNDAIRKLQMTLAQKFSSQLTG